MKFEELLYKDGKIVLNTKCDSCGHVGIDPIPKDVVKLMKDCGCDDRQIVRNYREHCLKNSWFSSFGSQKCDICGKKRVLCWYDGCSPSGVNVTSPSSQMNFWPNYDYPSHDVVICKWCMPDNTSKKSRDEFLRNLGVAMRKKETESWVWKSKNDKR